MGVDPCKDQHFSAQLSGGAVEMAIADNHMISMDSSLQEPEKFVLLWPPPNKCMFFGGPKIQPQIQKIHPKICVCTNFFEKFAPAFFYDMIKKPGGNCSEKLWLTFTFGCIFGGVASPPLRFFFLDQILLWLHYSPSFFCHAVSEIFLKSRVLSAELCVIYIYIYIHTYNVTRRNLGLFSTT